VAFVTKINIEMKLGKKGSIIYIKGFDRNALSRATGKGKAPTK
jgi:hypothetical protein